MTDKVFPTKTFGQAYIENHKIKTRDNI